MSQTAPPPGQSWEYHTQRIRRMQRLQVIALALMCLGSIAVAIVFGRVLLSSSAEQRVASAELRSLMDARTQILSIENVARRGDINPESLRRLFAVYVSFRSSLQTMLANEAVGESAVVARSQVAESIADLDRAMEPYLRQGLSNIDVPRMISELSELNLTLGAGLEQWMAFASDRYSSAVRRGEQLASRLFIATITLMSLLGLLAWGWWVLLERARQKMTDSVGDSERRFRSLVQNSSDAVVIVGSDAVIKYAAPPVELMFGRSAAELLNTPLSRLVHPHEEGAMGALDTRGVVTLLEDDVILWRGVHADGSPRFLETVATNMLGDPAIGGVVLNTRDVSDRHEAERELAYRANHDPLTDLANRAMFESRLGHLLTSRDVRGFVPAVLILDLDDFKTINDSLGHGAGDQLLVLVAHRVRTCLRSVDLAARFGGDEFAVLLEGTRSRGEVEVLAKRLVEVIAEPMMIEGRELEMHASIGIALIEPGRGTSAASLIRDADVAMYVAKDSGRAGYVVFDQSMSARASERLGLIADLRKAVERGEISLNYQPIVSLESHRVIGVEALLRWHHPTRGWVPPARFVELAEETGQIQQLGGWVLNHALDQMVALDEVVVDPEPLHLAVNVSMRQLEQENFAEFVAQSLGRSGFPADRVLVEITETALMRDPDTMLRQLQLLKRLGVTIAIDDFGTGYSSLSYLAHLPIDIVKIDRSFVEGIGNSARDTRIANMIMGIGQSLSLKTVAEGVETPAQLAALQDLGCSMVQGFLFGRPMTFMQLRDQLSVDGVHVDIQAAAVQAENGARHIPERTV